MLNDYRPDTVPMILRRLRTAAGQRPIQTHTHFHLAPRLNFTIVNPAAHSATVRVERILRSTRGERLVHREELVRRVIEKSVRREAGSVPAMGQAAAPQSPALTRTGVPAVLLRSSAPTPAAVEPAAAPVPQRSWQQVPSVQVQPDLARLSDEVIRTIDRRLQAHRERLGGR